MYKPEARLPGVACSIPPKGGGADVRGGGLRPLPRTVLPFVLLFSPPLLLAAPPVLRKSFFIAVFGSFLYNVNFYSIRVASFTFLSLASKRRVARFSALLTYIPFLYCLFI